MKQFGLIATLAVFTAVLSSCAPGSYLARANEDCKKYITPDAQATCESKYKETSKEFEKYRAKKESDDKGVEKGDSKNNELCFKSANGDLRCPN